MEHSAYLNSPYHANEASRCFDKFRIEDHLAWQKLQFLVSRLKRHPQMVPINILHIYFPFIPRHQPPPTTLFLFHLPSWSISLPIQHRRSQDPRHG